MLALSRSPRRRSRSRLAAVATGALLVVLAGCSGESDPQPPPESPAAESTPLDDYDTTDLTLVRSGFCDRVAEESIAAALGGGDATGDSTDDSIRAESWQPGTRLPESKDISNEFGCSWASGPVAARAWVFAPPITAPRAVDLTQEAVDKKCERLETAAALGEPSVAQHCGNGAEVTRFHGLVGDSWIGCEISGLPASGGDDTARVGEWCVAVLEALRAV